MIRIDDPANLGAALLQLRTMLQLGRRELSRDIAALTGRDARAVNSQLWGWENGDYAPNPTSMGPLLEALGWQLALVPVIETAPGEAPGSTESAEQASGVDGEGRGDSRAAGTRSGGESTNSCASNQPWRCTKADCPGCFNPHCWAEDEKTCRTCGVKPRTATASDEDQRRFTVEGATRWDDGVIWLNCDRCEWTVTLEDAPTLAELNQRADEHAEVCR